MGPYELVGYWPRPDDHDPTFIHGPEDGSHFAPGYYSILFEDPDGIRVKFNYVPGKGHFGNKGRLGARLTNKYGNIPVGTLAVQ